MFFANFCERFNLTYIHIVCVEDTLPFKIYYCTQLSALSSCACLWLTLNRPLMVEKSTNSENVYNYFSINCWSWNVLRRKLFSRVTFSTFNLSHCIFTLILKCCVHCCSTCYFFSLVFALFSFFFSSNVPKYSSSMLVQIII